MLKCFHCLFSFGTKTKNTQTIIITTLSLPVPQSNVKDLVFLLFNKLQPLSGALMYSTSTLKFTKYLPHLLVGKVHKVFFPNLLNVSSYTKNRILEQSRVFVSEKVFFTKAPHSNKVLFFKFMVESVKYVNDNTTVWVFIHVNLCTSNVRYYVYVK